MPTPASSQVVHEAAAQRQHVRVRLPGVVEFDHGREHQRLRIYDLSAGGFSMEAAGKSVTVGDSFRGSLIFNIDGVALMLTVTFQVRNLDARSRRAGCCFLELGPKEVSVLRHLITSSLSGDVVTMDDVLHTLSRNNFTKERQNGETQNGNGSNRWRAMGGTAIFLTLGLLAFGYTLSEINRLLFVSTATAAKVAGPTYTIAMPREGTFYSLIPADGMVKKGAPLGSYEAPMLDLVRNGTFGANLSPENLQRLMQVTMKGTITSPCDCRVQTQFVVNSQYVARGQPLFELLPRDFTPYLVARFRHDQINDLSQGSSVRFRVAGEEQERIGRITQVRAYGPGDTVQNDVIVLIEPVDPLPAELLSRPAEVVAGGFRLLPDALPRLAAVAGSDGAE